MLYAGLQIKQIQHETLSHFLLSRISTLYTDALVLHQIALSRYIYPANEEESPPQIFRAFVEGTYHNVPDFWELWMKLRHSLTRTLLTNERDYIERATGQVTDPVENISGTVCR
jgi:N-terminal acetyltransferase B complex non-catalytic subunit